eukprot:s6027_g3.t1
MGDRSTLNTRGCILKQRAKGGRCLADHAAGHWFWRRFFVAIRFIEIRAGQEQRHRRPCKAREGGVTW